MTLVLLKNEAPINKCSPKFNGPYKIVNTNGIIIVINNSIFIEQ